MQSSEHGLWFPAVLKTPKGEVLAEGSAAVSPETRDINFRSDFVPLFPVGTQLEIHRMREEEEIHRFSGKVYISDKALLRLVGVTDHIPPDPKHMYCTNLPFSGTIEEIAAPASEQKRRLFRRLRRASAPVGPLLVPIVSLSENRLVFLYDSAQPFYAGQIFHLTANMPLLLPKTAIEVESAILFGVNASYLCRFLELTEEQQSILRYFLLEYSLRQQREATAVEDRSDS